MAINEEGVLTIPIAIFTIAIIYFTVVIVRWLNRKTSESKKEPTKPKEQPHNGSHPKHDQKQKKKMVNAQKSHSSPPVKFEHSHLITSLKGHTAPLTGGDFSPSGKHFITASQDRTVLIWNKKDFSNKDRKSFRGNISFDHASHICWSPDSKAFIIYKVVGNVIEVYKVSKKPNGSFGDFQKAITFSEKYPDSAVVALDVATNGRFIMTCDDKNSLILWDLKGGVLDKFDTRHGDTYSACISTCGRFVATTGFTPDAKVWEVNFSKNGSYESTKRVFDLKGHTSGLFNCSFNCDSSKMVTISKDGTWRLYNTQVEYKKGQEPYFILSGKYEKHEGLAAMIRISPDGRAIAVASGSDLTLYSAITGTTLYCINNIYTDRIVQLKFDPSNKFILTLGDKHVRVFHNVAGYQATIQDLEQSKAKATTAGMRERIDVQIKDAKAALASINKCAPE